MPPAPETAYTRDILRAAVTLAEFPLTGEFDEMVTRRSPVCGSSITLGLAFDSEGRVARVGIAPQMCAFGQAAAATFAAHAIDRDAAALVVARDTLTEWLADPVAPMPDWPGFAVLDPVRPLGGRHGAVSLAFEAGAEAALAHVARARAA